MATDNSKRVNWHTVLIISLIAAVSLTAFLQYSRAEAMEKDITTLEQEVAHIQEDITALKHEAVYIQEGYDGKFYNTPEETAEAFDLLSSPTSNDADMVGLKKLTQSVQRDLDFVYCLLLSEDCHDREGYTASPSTRYQIYEPIYPFPNREPEFNIPYPSVEESIKIHKTLYEHQSRPFIPYRKHFIP